MADDRKRPIAIRKAVIPNAPQEISDSGKVAGFFGLNNLDRHALKLQEITQLLWLPKSLTPEEVNVRLVRAIELYESLAPADGAEGMLALQMIGTHHAALECLRRAALPEQSFEVCDMSLKHAAKLMALYEKQMSALNKSRGKGQQKMTVEHIHVGAGGQAIVGNVQTGRATSWDADPGMLEEGKTISPLETRRKHGARR